jgi:hypothetical protein
MGDLHDIAHARLRRSQRATALAALETGQADIAQALRSVPAALSTTDLWVLLLACPGIGRTKARIVCERARVFPNTPLGQLSAQQRHAVIDCLPD